MKTQRVGFSGRILAGAILAALLAGEAGAATGTWTNTANGVVDYWTTAANWNAATYPGQDASSETASLTNPVSGSYAAVVNTTLPYTLGSVEIKNHGGGAASVIVTNSIFSISTSLYVRMGGGLTINNLGVVTNAGLTYMDESNGQITVNSGGAFFSPNTIYVGSISGCTNNSFTIGNNGVVSGRFLIGSSGSSYNTLQVPGSNVVIHSGGAATPEIGASGTPRNSAVFTGMNNIWDIGGAQDLRIGGQSSSGQSFSNYLMVSGGSLTLTNIAAGNGFYIGYSSGGSDVASYNQLIVTNGGYLYTKVGDVAVGAGPAASSNVAIVSGANSLWNAGAGSTGVKIGGSASGPSGGSFNQIIVAQGGTITNCSIRVGYNNPLSCGNGLIVTNGGQVFGSGGSMLVGDWGTNNFFVITGPNSLLNLGGGGLNVGMGSSSSTSTTSACSRVQIDSGGVVTNGYVYVGNNLYLGIASTFSNTLVITNGGQLFTTLPVYINYIGAASSSNSAVVDGTNSVWSFGSQALVIGYTNNVGNQLTVSDGGTVSNVLLTVGQYAGANSNTLTITSGGRVYATSVTAGSATAMTNQVLIGAGALLAANSLTNGGVTAGNVISNAGGIFEFTTVTPTVTPNGVGGIVLAGGKISFRAINNADMYCDQSGKSLNSANNMTFLGNNAFRLNWATNQNYSSQAYTFDPAYGATNFYRLEMVNGSTCYRGTNGDSLTIGQSVGSGGQMLCSNTAATVNLIFTNNGTLSIENSTLTFGANAVMNGALVVDLNNLTPAQAAGSAAVLTVTSNLTINGTSSLVFTGTGTNLTLAATSGGGTLSSKFGSTTCPSGYAILYNSSSIKLTRVAGGSALYFW